MVGLRERITKGIKTLKKDLGENGRGAWIFLGRIYREREKGWEEKAVWHWGPRQQEPIWNDPPNQSLKTHLKKIIFGTQKTKAGLSPAVRSRLNDARRNLNLTALLLAWMSRKWLSLWSKTGKPSLTEETRRMSYMENVCVCVSVCNCIWWQWMNWCLSPNELCTSQFGNCE